MEPRFYYIELYDLYGDLLTEKQKNYFEDYYFQNLTLAELSENYGVSRNAIHKQLKEVLEKLDRYELILNDREKREKLLKWGQTLSEEQQRVLANLLE